jgi:tetratricopeptide (TPR) repeat protein
VTEQPGRQSRPSRRHTLWGREIPFRNPHFTGRSRELDELRKRLVDGSTAVIAQPGVPLYGLGGVGKTEIAAEYAYRFRDKYSLCWWVRCEQEDLIVNSLLNLGRMMRLPDFRVEERDYSIDLVIDALNRGDPYAEWLLIFDNATNAETVTSYIPQGPGHVIVTSRDSRWRKSLRADGIEVGEFQPAETVEFLRKRVPALRVLGVAPEAAQAELAAAEAENARRGREAGELAAELANLPLAAEHAAAYLAETATSVPKYLELFRENAHRLLATVVDIPYPQSVATTWSVSRGTISPAADALFELLAFFAPEPIYEELLLQPGKVPSLPDALAHVLTETSECRRAARELARFSLVKINGVRNVIQVHRVVQAVTRGQLMREDPEKAVEYRGIAHAVLAASDPNAPDRDDSEEAYERSRQHLVASGALKSDNPLVRRLVINQVRRLHKRGGFSESLNLGEPALAEWRDRFGADDRQTLALAVEVAFALRNIGRWEEALALNADTLDRLLSQFGEEDQAYLTCARSYGIDLGILGRYAEALEHDMRLLPLYERVFLPAHVDTLHLRNNIAISLRCLGRFDEALEYDRQTLAERERVLGHTDSSTLTSRFAIARDLRRMGRFEEALDEIRAVNDILEHKGEPWNEFRLLVATDLGVSLRRVGFYEEAAEQGEMVLQRHVAMLGEQHRETLRAATNIINDRRLIDDLKGAQELGERTLAAWEKTVGPDHPNTVAARTNLALALHARRNPQAARELNERALTDFIRIFGEEHPSPIVVMTNLASDLAVLGEVRRARQIGEHALELSRRVRGDTHPCTLATAMNLSLDRRADGDATGAQELREQVLAQYPQVLGPEHPESRLATNYGRVTIDIEPMMY